MAGLKDAILELKSYGVPGILVMSYLINLIPAFPAIYLAVMASIAVAVDDVYYEAALVLAGGVGAGLGKVTLFLAAKTLGGRLARGAAASRARYLVEHAGGSLFIIVFLFAALPLPDDSLYLPLGAAGYSTTLFAVAVTLGKTVMGAVVVGLANAAEAYLERLMAMMTSGDMLGLARDLAVFVAATIVFTLAIYRVDWPRVIDAYTRHGALKAAEVMAEELFKVVVPEGVRRRAAGAASRLRARSRDAGD